jgi:hypothetical protein
MTGFLEIVLCLIALTVGTISMLILFVLVFVL